MLDKSKILLAVICNDELELQQQQKFFVGSNFSINISGIKSNEAMIVLKDKSLAKTLNQIQRASDAKYKIFLTAPLSNLEELTFMNMMRPFFDYSQFGMVGLLGSEMPFSGDYTKAKKFYGAHFSVDSLGDGQGRVGETPVFYQPVHMIDGGLFAISEDIPFDEDVGDDFVIAAQCCRYRRAGHKVGVVYLDGIKVVFSRDCCIYKPRDYDRFYKERLKFFAARYKDIIAPLVSICIPTYNQPQFLEIALQSALVQTYPNIEIIVGDDSTNEETKELIKPYLEQYSNLKYFYHGGPLGGKGARNTTFIINKTSGEYINVLFHDDLLAKEKIARMMEYFISDLNNRINLIMSSRMLMDEKDQIKGAANSWQPPKNEILDGESVGRVILFSKMNFLGELSTGLMRKSDLLTKDAETGEEIFDIGVFCGVKDVAYGDLGTWLNLLKSGGQCVFIKDYLSAFRRHSAQNTYNLFIRVRLLVESHNYVTISWLNNIYLHDYNEYKIACRNWVLFFQLYYPKEAEADESEDIQFLLSTIKELKDYIIDEKFPETLDCSIRFLLDVLPEKNAIRPLVRKNEETGLWEKANDKIMLRGEQRC